MANLNMQRQAFDQVRKNTYRGRALVFVQCCRCSIVYKALIAEVTGFSEWFYKREEPHQVKIGGFIAQVKYTSFEHHACCPLCTMDSPVIFKGGFVPGLLEALYPKKVVEKVAPLNLTEQLCDIPDDDFNLEEFIF